MSAEGAAQSVSLPQEVPALRASENKKEHLGHALTGMAIE
jgi:hypothetical protein